MGTHKCSIIYMYIFIIIYISEESNGKSRTMNDALMHITCHLIDTYDGVRGNVQLQRISECFRVTMVFGIRLLMVMKNCHLPQFLSPCQGRQEPAGALEYFVGSGSKQLGFGWISKVRSRHILGIEIFPGFTVISRSWWMEFLRAFSSRKPWIFTPHPLFSTLLDIIRICCL